MAAQYEIFPLQRLIVTTYSGTFTINDVISLRIQIANDPAYQPDFNSLDDVTRVEKIDADFKQLAHMSSGVIIEKGVRRALVASSSTQFGMVRIYQALCEQQGHIFNIFDNYDEAHAWITGDINS